MMRFLFSAMVCALFALPLHAAVVLLEDFEDNAVTFTTNQPLFHDGNADFFDIVPLNGPDGAPGSPFTGFQGSNFFAVEDIDDGGTRPSQGILTFNITNLGTLTDISVDLMFAAGGNSGAPPAYDSNDGFLLRASLNGGGTWQNLLAFEAAGVTNQLLLQDTNFDDIGDGFQPSGTFTNFNNLTVAGSSANLLVQVIFDSNDGSGEMAIDNFRINATAVPEPTSLGLVGLAGVAMFLRRRRSQSLQSI